MNRDRVLQCFRFAAVIATLAILLWSIGCSASAFSPDRRVTPSIDAEHSDVTQTTNDPTSINILAYMVGGSVLIGSISQAWYNRSRMRHFENGGGKT